MLDEFLEVMRSLSTRRPGNGSPVRVVEMAVTIVSIILSNEVHVRNACIAQGGPQQR